jgi:hypothetical protein
MRLPPENACRWIDQASAFRTFATYAGPTQSQAHIKPLHWHVACRLVVEGGFLPEEITPRPPLCAVRKGGAWHLAYDADVAEGGERTLLGGLKTKNVDVVVVKEGIGPVLAISCKGAIGAFRNLTNRMEEAVGDCTNLHITYPALVTGHFMIMRAHRQDALLAKIATEDGTTARGVSPNDIALKMGGEPVESVVRFHNALRELTGRRGIRDDVSRYEAVALTLVTPAGESAGQTTGTYPADDSPLRIERFFETLYRSYDERYVYSAPDLKAVTMRKEWAETSPVLTSQAAALPVDLSALGYGVRTAAEE